MFQVKKKERGTLWCRKKVANSSQENKEKSSKDLVRRNTRVVGKDVVDAAWNAVDKRMDILTIVKELTALRFIVDTLISQE